MNHRQTAPTGRRILPEDVQPSEVARIGAALRPGATVSVRVIDPDVGETLINSRLRR